MTVEMIIANLTQNAKTAQQIIASAVEAAAVRADLRVRVGAQIRPHHRPDAIPAQVRQDLAPLVGKYLQTT